MRAFAWVMVCACTVSIALPANAAPLTPSQKGDAAVAEAARVRFAEGVKLYGKKRYDKALAAFFQAYSLTHNPAILVNLGLTSLKLGDPMRAVRYFTKFREDAPDAGPDPRERAERGIAEARRSLGRIEVTAPEGTEITLDGEPAGRAPLAAPLDAAPGKHTVATAGSAGAKSEQVVVKVGAEVKVHLVPAGPAVAPPNAVQEPDVGAPSPPSSGSSAAAGTSGAAGADAGDESTGFFAPPNAMTPVYVAGAIGLVSLTVAVVAGGVGTNADRNVAAANDALARNGKKPADCGGADATLASTCGTLASASSTSKSMKTPFVASLAIGGGATLFALGWYFFASKGHASGTPTVEPSVGLHDAGIRFSAEF